MTFVKPQVQQRFSAQFTFGGAQIGEFLADLFEFFAFFYLDEMFQEKKVLLIQRRPRSGSSRLPREAAGAA